MTIEEREIETAPALASDDPSTFQWMPIIARQKNKLRPRKFRQGRFSLRVPSPMSLATLRQ
jgi:hypothetical protein